MINIALVDDHKIVRDGIKALLKDENINVIGEASNGAALIKLLEEITPDLIIMDMNMPEQDGFLTMQKIREKNPEQKVMVLSMHDNEKYVARMLQLGASGYALKNIGKEELVCGIRLIETGNKFICTDLSMSFLGKLVHTPTTQSISNNHQEKKGAELSQREIEVLRLIAEGLTNAEIADKLFTSKRTIESHRQNIIEKTQVKNTAALIKYALTHGLID
ncbi:response regulator transcription factor [Adhaeribacter soli]|uniref:Response regulator transcription factor n=1 Tax=Adhaeribacter soli TaxID=2607655 RepID=A0A5N1J5M8_9BACT|nr:response regulator transcription factor [Adhaeribacter soli]